MHKLGYHAWSLEKRIALADKGRGLSNASGSLFGGDGARHLAKT
jgi:hypothetical protein